MKQDFINNAFLYKAVEGEGGFTPEQKGELADALNKVQSVLSETNKTEIKKAVEDNIKPINEAISKFKDSFAERDEADKANQKTLDDVLIKLKGFQSNSDAQPVRTKSLQEAMMEALSDPDNVKAVESVSKGKRAVLTLKGPIDLSAPTRELWDPNIAHKNDGGGFIKKDIGAMQTKVVGNMTVGNNLTGDGVITYNNRQVILPSQKLNARDMVNTVRSETGIYVTYRETAGEGAIARQTEGSAKGQIDFDFTEVKTVNEYIAGFTRFSKQLSRHLPWLQGTLPRLLQREFFKVENRRFWDLIATAATGSSTTTETDDVKQVMDWITNLFESDYMASYGVLRYTALNRLNKLLYTNGYYQGSGGVVSRPDGSVSIMGVPIVPVTWIPSFDKFTTFDRDYIERVEVESLSIEFFMEDSDNVQKNLITARIECFEEFNVMQPASIVIGDFGNSSTS